MGVRNEIHRVTKFAKEVMHMLLREGCEEAGCQEGRKKSAKKK